LNTITAKKVRQQLETDLKIDLADRKKEIDELVMEILEERKDTEGNEEDESSEEEKKPAKGRRAPKRGKDSDSDKDSEEEYVPKGKKKGRKSGSDSGEDWGKKKKSGGSAKSAPKKGGGTGFTKTCKLSSELAAVMGEDAMARHEVVKRMWAIIKEKNLYDPKNKQFAICNEELLPVFGVKRFRTFGMMKYLKNHFVD